MMISVQDFFDVQGQTQNPTALGKLLTGKQDKGQSPAGNPGSKHFQNLVDNAGKATESEDSLEGGPQQTLQSQSNTGEDATVFQKLAAAELRKVGFPEEKIPDIFEQLDDQTLAGLLAAAITVQGDKTGEVFSGGAFQEQGPSTQWLDQIFQQIGHKGKFNPVNASKAGASATLMSFLQTEGKALLGNANEQILRDAQKFLSEQTPEQGAGFRELHAILSGQKTQGGLNARDLRGVLSMLQQAVRSGDSVLDQNGQEPTGSAQKGVVGTNGQEALQSLVARIRGLAAHQAPGNQEKPAYKQALKQSPGHADVYSPSGNRWFGVSQEGTESGMRGGPKNLLQFEQAASQTQDGRMAKASHPVFMKSQAGLDSAGPAAQAGPKGAGQLFDGAGSPAHSPILQGLQEMSQSPVQAKPAAFPVMQQQAFESNVVQQVFVRLVSGMQQGSRSMVINMHPPELGRVKVSLVSDGGRLSAVLHTENQQVQGVLDRHLPQLRQSLQEQGLSIADLGVSLESGGHEGQSDFEDETAGLFAGQRLKADDAETETEEAAPVFSEPSGGHLHPEQGFNIRV